MLIIVSLIGFVTNFGLTRCVVVDIKIPSPVGNNTEEWGRMPCKINSSYNLTKDEDILLNIHKKKLLIINFGSYTWMNATHTMDEKILQALNETISFKIKVNHTSLMSFTFLHSPNQNNNGTINKTYTHSLCETNFNVVASADAGKVSNNTWIWVSVGVIAGAIIVAQAVALVYFKAKAKTASMNTRMTEGSVKYQPNNDNARYSSTPVANRDQKGMKVPPLGALNKDERESQVYETINVNFLDPEPPPPPALNTLPRTPKPRHQDIGTPSMGQLRIVDHPSPIVRIRELEKLGRVPAPSIESRPPIAIPEEDVYEELPSTENTNEAPKTLLLPPRSPPVKMMTAPPKPRIVRPGLTPNPVIHSRTVPRKPVAAEPKPKLSPASPAINELDQVLQKRRNVLQTPKQPDASAEVPVNSITLPPKPKPPAILSKPKREPPTSILEHPAVFSKPKRELPSNPVPNQSTLQEDDMYDEDEWTYEPLKPLDEVMKRRSRNGV